MNRFTSCSILLLLQIIAAVHSRNVVTRDLSSNELLPSNCGEDTRRDLERHTLDLNEFPWLGLLEYRQVSADGGNKTILCNGFLISKRYVVTAARCLRVAEDIFELVSVRFGEYNTTTERDCVKSGDGNSEICSDNPISVDIDEKIIHENHRTDLDDQSNDIGLLRLSRDVTFTEYIKPICLPTNSSTIDQFVVIAAQGFTNAESNSMTKLKFKIPLQEHAHCWDLYRAFYVDLADSQICAGFEEKRDFCLGSTGAPLMTWKESQNDKRHWTAVGIASFGPGCQSHFIRPNIYTKLDNYVPWILSKMRA